MKRIAMIVLIVMSLALVAFGEPQISIGVGGGKVGGTSVGTVNASGRIPVPGQTTSSSSTQKKEISELRKQVADQAKEIEALRKEVAALTKALDNANAKH